jgi:hypothetical protein
MNRRGFFGLLGAVAAAAAFDPERALWVPGAKTISIPAPLYRLSLIGEVRTYDGIGMHFQQDWKVELVDSFQRKIGEPITLRTPERYRRAFPVFRIGETIYRSELPSS